MPIDNDVRMIEGHKLPILDAVQFMNELNQDGFRLEARGIYMLLKDHYSHEEICECSERHEVDRLALR